MYVLHNISTAISDHIWSTIEITKFTASIAIKLGQRGHSGHGSFVWVKIAFFFTQHKLQILAPQP